MSRVLIEYLGGNCPVQAEGTVDGKEFYFRSRGDSWSLSVGGSDVVGEPEWYYEEDYGEWPDAGWISDEEARSFIAKAAELYRARVSDENRNGSDPEGLRSEGLPARCHEVTDALTLSPKEQKGE